MKTTLVHMGKKVPDRAIGITLLPMGLNALANYLEDHDFDAEVLHFDVEESLTRDFDLTEYLVGGARKIVGFDLHWHYQTRRVIDEAARIKRSIPESSIILGGFTASFFAEEILKTFREIDFVVRGDAEIPLLRLVEWLTKKTGGLGDIPNLAWRHGDKVRLNPQTYTVTHEVINSLRYGDFDRVRNHEQCLKQRLNFPHCLDCSFDCEKIFYFNCGRGCLTNCSFCSGSLKSQRMISARQSIIMMDHHAVIRELEKAKCAGIACWYSCFDPSPRSEYYLELFRKIRFTGLKGLNLQFECWALPTDEFIQEVSRTFSRQDSTVILSPETGSEHVRKKNKGFFYSNEEFIESVKSITARGLNVTAYFTVGLPFETPEHVLETFHLINRLKHLPDRSKINVSASPIEMEPAAPWQLDMAKYGLEYARTGLLDYYHAHGADSSLGYRLPSFPGDETLYDLSKLFIKEWRCTRRRSLFLEKMLNIPPPESKNYDTRCFIEACEACDRYETCFQKKDKNRSCCVLRLGKLLDGMF